jgi:ketosteroid isomerase-like protein
VNAALLFVAVELRVRHPILNLAVFTLRPFAVAAIVLEIMFVGINTALSFLPVFLQQAQQLTPSHAGMLFIPQALAWIVAIPLAGALWQLIGAKRVTIIGLALMGSGTLALSQLAVDSSRPALMAMLSLRALGIGLVMQGDSVVAHPRVLDRCVRATSNDPVFPTERTTTVAADEGAVYQTYLAWSNAFRNLDIAGLKSVFDSDFPGLSYQAEENVDPMYTWAAIDEYLSNAPRVVEAITEWRELTRKIAVDGNTAFVYAKLHTRLTVHDGLVSIPAPSAGLVRNSMSWGTPAAVHRRLSLVQDFGR